MTPEELRELYYSGHHDKAFDLAVAEIAKLRDILASIKWRSCEKDNMEFSAKITCFQKDKIDAALQKDAEK